MSSASLPPPLPIAIIGVACRLPGAPDVDAFWELLLKGHDTVGEIPSERFPIDQWHSPESTTPNAIASRAGGFLPDIDLFDAAFFCISPHEAARIDPQHRLLMEVTWEALEDAGLPAEQLAGSNTGVYTGCLSSDYWDLLRNVGAYDLHAAIGSGTWGIPAGRISHQLDLRGPSMGVEAACATSLLAVHLACDGLRSGQSDLAIVSSVNLLMSPDFYFSLSEASILSPRGRSRFGDAGADGYVRSEGAVALILKPQHQAIEDGDRIYATILGSSVTNNGSSAGTMISSGQEGQEAALRQAYRMAGVSPGDVDYVEAHGPGTPLGDKVELRALNQVMGQGRDAAWPCLIGSVKSNLGHTEVAAGGVGLLKAALAMRHGVIPSTLHVDQPNPELRGPDGPLRLVLENQPWPEHGRPALAGVSSFGLSGVNTHLVLQQAPPSAARPVQPVQTPPYLLPLSARSPQALEALADQYADVLLQQSSNPAGPGDPTELADLVHSAGRRRSHHPYRMAVIGSDAAGMSADLRSFGSGERRESTVGGDQRVVTKPRVVFVFSGHGSQWVGMGRSLLRTSAVFARQLRECSRVIADELGWSLIKRLRSDEPLTQADEVQPALWAIQVSLAAVWRDWGIEPDLVIGHSMGEIAAATVSGALSLTDGAAVVCRRSRLIREHARPGTMLAVQLGQAEALELIAPVADRVAVAVLNSDYSSVLSGEVEALDEIADLLRWRGIFFRRVAVDYASHAPQVEPVGPPLIEALSHLEPRTGTVPMYSTALSTMIDGSRLDAGYWMTNLREPVRFGDGVRSILADSRPTLFIEVNAHPLLLAAVEDTAASIAVQAPAIPSLMRDGAELDSLLTGLGQAYVLGCEPDWAALNLGGRYIQLPGYPWQRRRYWVSPEAEDAVSRGLFTPVSLPRTDRGFATTTDPDADPDLIELLGPEGEPVGRPKDVTRPMTTITSTAAMTEHLVGRVTEALGMSPGDMDLDVPLSALGLDSLLAARIGETLRRDLGLRVPARDLLAGQALSTLADQLLRRIRAAGDGI